MMVMVPQWHNARQLSKGIVLVNQIKACMGEATWIVPDVPCQPWQGRYLLGKEGHYYKRRWVAYGAPMPHIS